MCILSSNIRPARAGAARARGIGKAEVLHKEPHFPIVTNLPRKGFQTDASERFAPCKCYEEFYCPRGNMENEIKQQLLDLHAIRTDTRFMASNQLRLWLSTFPICCWNACAPWRCQTRSGASDSRHDPLAPAIGALITVSVRRVCCPLASAFALKELFEQAQRVLRAASGGGVAPHSFARTRPATLDHPSPRSQSPCRQTAKEGVNCTPGTTESLTAPPLSSRIKASSMALSLLQSHRTACLRVE